MGDLPLPGEIERDRLFPALLRSIHRQRATAAGAVDQNVDTAEPCKGASRNLIAASAAITSWVINRGAVPGPARSRPRALREEECGEPRPRLEHPRQQILLRSRGRSPCSLLRRARSFPQGAGPLFFLRNAGWQVRITVAFAQVKSVSGRGRGLRDGRLTLCGLCQRRGAAPRRVRRTVLGKAEKCCSDVRLFTLHALNLPEDPRCVAARSNLKKGRSVAPIIARSIAQRSIGRCLHGTNRDRVGGFLPTTPTHSRNEIGGTR